MRRDTVVSALLVLVIAALAVVALYSQRQAKASEARAVSAEAKVKAQNTQVETALRSLVATRDVLTALESERQGLRRPVIPPLFVSSPTKPTLEAVRLAWGITGRLECAVVPLGASRVAPETFLVR